MRKRKPIDPSVEAARVAARAICHYYSGESCACLADRDRCYAVDVYGGEALAVVEALAAHSRRRRFDRAASPAPGVGDIPIRIEGPTQEIAPAGFVPVPVAPETWIGRLIRRAA